MKRLVVIIQDEDLMRVLGTILKTGADFTVETVETEAVPERRLQRRTADGRRPSDIVMDEIAKKTRVSSTELGISLRDAGFASNTVYGTCGKLRDAGLIVADGDYWKAVQP